MKLKRSAQIMLVGLVGIAQCCIDLVALFSRRGVAYTFGLQQLLTLLCCIPWRIC